MNPLLQKILTQGIDYLSIKENDPNFIILEAEATNGDPDAQYALGMWFYYAARIDEAKIWLLRARDNNHAVASECYDYLSSGKNL